MLLIFVAPSMPEHLTAVYLSLRSVELTWSMPNIPQGIIEIYSISINGELRDGSKTGLDQIDYNISGDVVIDGYTHNLPNLNFTATALSPFSQYSIEVAAVGSHGRGAVASLTLYTNESG